MVLNYIWIIQKNNMEELKGTSEKIVGLMEKVNNYKKYILEYGFNPDKDIFIKEELENIKKILDSELKKL
tara:strand:+ start:2925 stop:3134 length:210 start_codon:yes stop_codon:yes gene_type:complete